MDEPLNGRLRALGAALRAPVAPVDVSGLRLLLKPEERSAEEIEWSRYLRTLERPDEYGTARTARWWCRECSAFASSEDGACAKCRARGPHHFGETPPNGPDTARRRRLRADHKRRRRITR